MTARPHASAVLSRTAIALAETLPQHRPVDLGHLLHRAHTTPARWADDLTAWPSADLLRLACADDHLRREIVAALTPEQPVAHPLEAERDLRAIIARAGGSIQRAMTVLEDSRIERAEIAPLLTDLRELQESVNTAIIDLVARQLMGDRP